MMLRKSLSTLFLLLFLCHLNAQELPDTISCDSVNGETKDVMHKYVEGVVIGVDVVSPITYVTSGYGSIEGMLKANISNRYFPCFEAGFASSDYTDDETDISYKTTAPYFRVGLDYNILRDKTQRTHILYAGFRYGFTTFKYDYSGETLDPITQVSSPFSAEGLSSTCHWGELLMGAQVSVLKNFHMAWTVRYKMKFKFGGNAEGDPYYVPGFGTTTSNSTWGITYNLIWDLRW